MIPIRCIDDENQGKINVKWMKIMLKMNDFFFFPPTRALPAGGHLENGYIFFFFLLCLSNEEESYGMNELNFNDRQLRITSES